MWILDFQKIGRSLPESKCGSWIFKQLEDLYTNLNDLDPDQIHILITYFNLEYKAKALKVMRK